MAIVVSGCGPADSSRPGPGVELRLIERFGSSDGALALRQIGSIALSQGRGDTLFLTQFQVPGILMLSAAGDSLGMIGRAGSGPGEFIAPFTPSILHDTLWIPDLNGTVSRFTARGEFIDQLRLRVAPFGPDQQTPMFVAALADGGLLYQGLTGPFEEARGSVSASALARVSRDGTVLDTVALLAVRKSSYRIRFANGSGMTGIHPAANPDLSSVDPTGRWIVVVSQQLDKQAFGFHVAWIDVAHDTLSDYRITTAPISAEGLKQEWLERLAAHEGRDRGEIADAVSTVPWPEYRAAAEKVFADGEGRAWVRSPHESPDSARWYVIDRVRGVVGSFVLPKRVALMAARSKIAWGWSPGPYDEPYVLKFQTSWVMQR